MMTCSLPAPARLKVSSLRLAGRVRGRPEYRGHDDCDVHCGDGASWISAGRTLPYPRETGPTQEDADDPRVPVMARRRIASCKMNVQMIQRTTAAPSSRNMHDAKLTTYMILGLG